MDTGRAGWRVVAGLVLLGACSPSNETGSSAKQEPAAPEEPVVAMPEPPRPPATPVPGRPNTDTGDTQSDVENPTPAPQEGPPDAGSRTTGRVLPIWNGRADDPTVVRVSAAGRCTDTGTLEGALSGW